MKNESGTLGFKVDAGLLFQLGERLVARSSVALAELIKNSYDADATAVTVLLENVSEESIEAEICGHKSKEPRHGTIIVEDNGSGMTFEDVEDHWMRIATIDKRRNPISPRFGRRRTGAKGVGRFAARKLADRLILSTVAQREDGSKERVYVEFDWSKFVAGEALTKTKVGYEREGVSASTPTGVILSLEDVRENWTQDDISELRKDLITLVSPFPGEKFQPEIEEDDYEYDPGFSITIETPDFPKLAGELKEYFLEAAWAVLSGWVDERGIAHYHLEILETDEKLDYVEDNISYKNLVGTEFEIHYLVYRASRFKDFDFGYREAVAYGRKHGGVRIFLNGFRVFGYGDQGDDWLRLNEIRAERRRHPEDLTLPLRLEAEKMPSEPILLIPGNNQIFGTVLLSQSHHMKDVEGIEINIGRERLVENQAFEQLRHFLRNGIFWLTIQYARVRYSNRISKPESKPDSIEPLEPQLDTTLDGIEQAVRTAEELSPPKKEAITKAVTTIREVTKSHDKKSKRIEEERISEIAMLRVLASTGTMISFLNHQLRAIVDNLGSITAVLDTYTTHLSKPNRADYAGHIQSLRRWHRYVEEQVNHLSFLLGKEARIERRPYNIQQAVQSIIDSLEGYRTKFGINVTNQVPLNILSPPMYLAEIHAILINIFTNALKAVRHQPRRDIMFTGSRHNNNIHIRLFDTGKGLDISPPEKAFEPFETTTTPDPILGTGTGLGLYVVSSLLEGYDGDAHFIEAESPWRTCIEIILPRK